MERCSCDPIEALQVSELLQKGRVRGGTRSYNQVTSKLEGNGTVARESGRMLILPKIRPTIIIAPLQVGLVKGRWHFASPLSLST